MLIEERVVHLLEAHSKIKEQQHQKSKFSSRAYTGLL